MDRRPAWRMQPSGFLWACQSKVQVFLSGAKEVEDAGGTIWAGQARAG